ncbi:hypothetical protein GOP47_0009185 [Adiantum capillus-veneris]|uniref:RecA family profile 1 domain-containing protein n=1 Tax=Adiantum capillus-veneris TaxID=13818 RepID=A0A9D4UW52_ADICA|nr:hypothetical protein GOP47_0009185 [Adiantum capillus-veneris]
MASRLLSGMQLDAPLFHVLHARGVLTAKDVLCKPELELMELLDLPLSLIREAIAQISLFTCPPYRSALTVMEERESELGFGHLRTHLQDIDSALLGGIPFGALTEVVGPAGFGKTQLCLMLCVITALPKEHDGLDGNVIYFDTERKFHSGRMAEMAVSRFPHFFTDGDNLKKLATSVLVYHPHSLDEFVNSLQGVEEVIIENKVKMLIVDSIAALMPSENAQEDLSRKQNVLGHQAGTLKYLAEAFRIPIVVTNQVRMTSNQRSLEDPELQLTAALGTSWAHSVNIRLILESLSGQRFIKVAKSPMSAITLHPYKVTSMGLELIGGEDYGQGGDVMRIRFDDLDANEDEDMEV